MKKILFIILTLVLTVTLGVQVTNAIGSLSPSGTAGDATQYTLNDIYTKLTVNTSTSTKSGSISLPESAIATFRTLTEIYNAIPTIDATKVATGTTYLGVRGTLSTTTPSLVWYDSSLNDDFLNWVSWENAITLCSELVAGGSSSWRLPTITELIDGISNEWVGPSSGRYNYFMDDTFYWSSDTNPDSSSYAWGAGLDTTIGFYINSAEKTNEYKTSCVR